MHGSIKDYDESNPKEILPTPKKEKEKKKGRFLKQIAKARLQLGHI